VRGEAEEGDADTIDDPADTDMSGRYVVTGDDNHYSTTGGGGKYRGDAFKRRGRAKLAAGAALRNHQAGAFSGGRETSMQ